MGAIVAALYATGHKSTVMRDLCKTLSLLNVFEFERMPWKGGAHGGAVRHAVEKHLSPLLGDAVIGDCKIPFVCVAGRVREPVRWEKILKSGFTEYYNECIEEYVFPPETRLLDAVMASSAVPILFHPVQIGSDQFIDLMNFGAIPAAALKRIYKPDVLIATDTNPDYQEVSRFLHTGWRQYLEAGAQSIEDSKKLCDLVIRPVMKERPFRFDLAEKFYEAGREAALSGNLLAWADMHGIIDTCATSNNTQANG
jgi:predicted acylesterase/phospholipase RssA